MAKSRETKKARDKAYRLRNKLKRGKEISVKDARWLAEYERRVLKRRLKKLETKKRKKPEKSEKPVRKPPTKKALNAYKNAFKRFLKWYGANIVSIEEMPYGSGVIIRVEIDPPMFTSDVDTDAEYPFDLVAKSLAGYIANVRIKLVSGRFYRWKSLAPLMSVDEVFIRAGIGLVRWALMMYPSSFEYREEKIVIFDSYIRRETPERKQ